MTYYLGNVYQFLSPKNKLEKAIQDFISTYHREIYAETEIERIKENIIDETYTLNTLHKMCRPVNPSWWTPRIGVEETTDWTLGNVNCVRFVFQQSKEYFTVE